MAFANWKERKILIRFESAYPVRHPSSAEPCPTRDSSSIGLPPWGVAWAARCWMDGWIVGRMSPCRFSMVGSSARTFFPSSPTAATLETVTEAALYFIMYTCWEAFYYITHLLLPPTHSPCQSIIRPFYFSTIGNNSFGERVTFLVQLFNNPQRALRNIGHCFDVLNPKTTTLRHFCCCCCERTGKVSLYRSVVYDYCSTYVSNRITNAWNIVCVIAQVLWESIAI